MDLSINRFTEQPMEERPAEELFAADWETLIKQHNGMDWELLRDVCVELRFPIAEGQLKNPAVLAALKRMDYSGAWVPDDPEGVRLYLLGTPVGRIPVIECRSDADFIRLRQSIRSRCEPVPVPDSQGADIIKNYNNWARVNMHRENGGIPKDPAMYRDYLILLSHRYYSGSAPNVASLDKQAWREKSMLIRREHEASHYMTQRYYHSAKNEIHDEIIADFMGLTAAFGEYDPTKFLAFIGLENYPDYRRGGRLELYLGGEPTEGEGFTAFCEAVKQAAYNIPACYRHIADREKMFHILCRTSVAEMARGEFCCLKV